jgi:hypothetical protein
VIALYIGAGEDMANIKPLDLGVLSEQSVSRASSGSAYISSTRILNEAFREHES